ncbi:MAG: hypothetical protein IPL24_12910 [Bacteroidetes bacterium]|nr:hypothetical protein [Bacteroidota bacterium]
MKKTNYFYYRSIADFHIAIVSQIDVKQSIWLKSIEQRLMANLTDLKVC